MAVLYIDWAAILRWREAYDDWYQRVTGRLVTRPTAFPWARV